MSENKNTLKGTKTPVYNHYPSKVSAINQQRPDISLSVLQPVPCGTGNAELSDAQ